MAADVQRYRLVIRFQAIAILFLSASGIIVGTWAGRSRCRHCGQNTFILSHKEGPEQVPGFAICFSCAR
jgi:hypothetical protein